MLDEREIRDMLHGATDGLKAAMQDYESAIAASDHYKAQSANYRIMIDRSRAETLLEVLGVDVPISATDSELIELEAKANE